LIERAKTLLGAKEYRSVFQSGLNEILADIRQDLGEFGINYQEWFSERQLMDDGSIDEALKRLDCALNQSINMLIFIATLRLIGWNIFKYQVNRVTIFITRLAM
jgi:arginyl-tRNA synthetase